MTLDHEQYLTAYEQERNHRAQRSPAWLNALRDASIAQFRMLGLPTPKLEAWKYTNVEPIAARQFAHANGEAKGIDGAAILTRTFVDEQAARLVFVNGTFVPELSLTKQLDQGLRLQRLSEFVAESESQASVLLGSCAQSAEAPFAALNTALFEDGAVVTVPAGLRLEQPIYLVFVCMGGAQPIASHPRVLLALGSRSEAKIVESYFGVGDGSYFCNAVTEIKAESDAIVEHYRVQQDNAVGLHVGRVDARLQRGAQLTAHAVTLGGKLVRNDVRVVLDGVGAECALNGLYIADGESHIDNCTEIEHAQPHARSMELYKGILGGAAHGVFNGKIIVRPDAQKSDARQTNKNLLLSDRAAVNTKPQLEIYADDVKCSHGSTIGQLDGDALFYLRSRGLGIKQARSLLSFAFAADVVDRMKIASLREKLDEKLMQRFARA